MQNLLSYSKRKSMGTHFTSVQFVVMMAAIDVANRWGNAVEMSQLRVFRAVAETLNFTRAAQRLNMTQSAVSHHIKTLETELGEPLFVRARRGVTLTDSGKLALTYVESILDGVDALREHISEQVRSPAGRVRAAAATQAFVHLFAPLFESFMRRHSRVDLTFRTTASTDQTTSDILSGSADVGFVSLPVYSPALEVQELFQDELLVIVGAGHPLAGSGRVQVREISRERLILFERGASIRRATDAFFRSVGIRPEQTLESNDTYFIKSMVERGVGISLLPAWAARDEVAAGKLAKLEIEGQKLSRSVAMVSLRQFQPSPVRAFIAYILDRKAELQGMAEG